MSKRFKVKPEAFAFKTTSIILVFSEKPLILRTAMQEAPLPVFLFIVHH